MKTPRLLIAVLPLLFLASASSDHVAIGTVRFGMTHETSMKQHSDWGFEHKRQHQELTPAVLRKELLYAGTKAPGQLIDKDAGLLLRIDFRFSASGKMNVVEFRDRTARTAPEWDTTVKDSWLQFRDVCDSKFSRAANTKPGEWPVMDALPPEGFTATDTWEYEGVKVELGLLSSAKVPDSAARAAVMLRVTNTLTK